MWQGMQRISWKRFPLSSSSLPQFGLRSNSREGTQPHPSTENWIIWLKIYWSWPCPSEQDPVFPTVAMRKLQKNLLSLSLREQTEWKTSHRKTNWSDGQQPCLIQWNYEPCHVRPRKTDGEWRILIKCGPLERKWQTTSAFLSWEPHEQ